MALLGAWRGSALSARCSADPGAQHSSGLGPAPSSVHGTAPCTAHGAQSGTAHGTRLGTRHTARGACFGTRCGFVRGTRGPAPPARATPGGHGEGAREGHGWKGGPGQLHRTTDTAPAPGLPQTQPSPSAGSLRRPLGLRVHQGHCRGDGGPRAPPELGGALPGASAHSPGTRSGSHRPPAAPSAPAQPPMLPAGGTHQVRGRSRPGRGRAP